MANSNEKGRSQTYNSLTKEISAKKHAAGAPGHSRSPLSPTSNNRRPPLAIDSKDDADLERNYGDSIRNSTPTQIVSPTSAAFSKLITNVADADGTDKQRLQTYQTSATKHLSAVASPKSKPNLVIDTKDSTTAGSLPAEQSPRVSPSLFQQSTDKVGLHQHSFSMEASKCGVYHGEQRTPAAAFSRLIIGPTSPMSKTVAGTDRDDKTAARVSNFIDSLHQKRGIPSTPRGAGNISLFPPKSPSAARLASSNRYSSILSNARSVIASSPVSIAHAAAVPKGSPHTGTSLENRKNLLQKSPGHHKALDSDNSDTSDDDSSSSSDSSHEAAASTQKDVADFIETFKGEGDSKVPMDMELLSSMKAKLNMRKSEVETAAKKNREILYSFKAQLGAQEKTKSEPLGTEEKKDETAEVDTPHDYASKHNIKKDVHYYAVLSEIQMAVQSDNPSLLMGKILADAGRRGMKLVMVTEMIKEEKLKAKACKHEKVETVAQGERQTPKKKLTTEARVLVREQTSKGEKSVKNVEAVENKQSMADIDMQSASKPKAQPASCNSSSKDVAATSSPSNAPSVAEKASEVESNTSFVNNMPPPIQEVTNVLTSDYVAVESKIDNSALMSEVEGRIKELVRSATPSIEFGKILADAKKKGLPTSHLIRLYKQEREELTNAAVKAACLVIKPEDNELSNSEPEGIAAENPPMSAGVSMKEQLTKEVQNAVRSSNPPEMLGRILAEAKSKGMATEWLFEIYTKERILMQDTAVKEQGAKPPVNEISPTESDLSDISPSESEVSDISEAPVVASSNVVHSPVLQQVTGVKCATDVDDFFSKFSLHDESKDATMDTRCVKQDLASSVSVSEVSEHEIVEIINEETMRGSQESELPAKTSVCRVEATASTSSKDNINAYNINIETAHEETKKNIMAMRSLWKSPLQKQRISRRKLSKGGNSKPINGVSAAAALSRKRRLRGPRRTHLTQSTQERTKDHRGFLDIDFYSLYESTTCLAEDEEIDKVPWEYRDVRQRFLSEKSIDCRNWFGSFEHKRGNDRISNPVSCPKSLQIKVTKIPESGDWNEDWYTTWKSRRDNPNNLVTFTVSDIPSLSMNSTGTSNTSTTVTESNSYDKSVESSDTAPCKKKAVLIEIGNIVSVRFGTGERVSKVHPDYTSSLRRSRWRKKYMQGEFAFDAEMHLM